MKGLHTTHSTGMHAYTSVSLGSYNAIKIPRYPLCHQTRVYFSRPVSNGNLFQFHNSQYSLVLLHMLRQRSRPLS